MSYFLPDCRALFLHIPRTGGTWVGRALTLTELKVDSWGRVCEMYRPRKHTLLPHYRPELLLKVEYIYTFVRRPVEYYVSVWRFTTRAVAIHPEEMEVVFGGNNPIAINEGVNRWKPDFNEWMEEMLEEEPGWMTRMVERYVGPHRGEFCHFIGRTETLESDMGQIMKILGHEKEWENSKEKRDQIIHARNTVKLNKAPHIKMDDTMKKRIERSEKVYVRRFFGEETINKRVYRNLAGEPI